MPSTNINNGRYVTRRCKYSCTETSIEIVLVQTKFRVFCVGFVIVAFSLRTNDDQLRSFSNVRHWIGFIGYLTVFRVRPLWKGRLKIRREVLCTRDIFMTSLSAVEIKDFSTKLVGSL